MVTLPVSGPKHTKTDILDSGARALFAAEVGGAMLVADYLQAVLRGDLVDVALWAVSNYPAWAEAPGVRMWIKAELDVWRDMLKAGRPVSREFGSILALWLGMNNQAINLNKHHRRTNVARLRYNLKDWAGRIQARDYGVMCLVADRAMQTIGGSHV